MPVDLKAAVLGSIDTLKKTIAKKASEMTRLEKELERHQTVLALLADRNGVADGKGKRNRNPHRANLRAVLSKVRDTFTTKEFVKEAAHTKKEPIYIRQTLSRWAREGKLKRLARGKYQKLKKASVQHLAA